MHKPPRPRIVRMDNVYTISFLPKNKTLTRVKIIRILGFQLRVRRAITVEYSLFDHMLHVTYRCPNGYRLFLDREKHKAEQWIGRRISISPFIGQVIISKRLACVSRIACQHCSYHTLKFPNHINVIGTIGQVTGHISIHKPEWDLRCERCFNLATVTLETTQQ